MRSSPPKAFAAQEVVHPHAAGIDIGAEESYVAVPADRDAPPVRRFGCFTQELHALADWLAACGIETVAMESTGVYWVPLYQVLETRGFAVYLVNPGQVKAVPGRKSDVADCQWLQQLHTFGLLAASFRPADALCVLRTYWRQREQLTSAAATQIQHMHKALEQMNIQLHKVLSDLSGVSGLRIVDAIVAGQRDPYKLAALKDGRVQSSVERIAQALTGDYRPEHLFSLEQAVATYRFYQQQIAQCDQRIEAYLTTLAPPDDRPAPRVADEKRTKPKGNQPAFDLRAHQARLYGVDFTALEGFEVLTIQTLLSEVGLDPSKFPTVKHFCSWLGLCPQHKITGGKIISRRTKKTNNRAAKALRLAAQSVSRSQGPLGAFYRRLRARVGPAAANTATAHKMARLFYFLWKNPQPYDPSRMEQNEQQHTQRTLNYLKKKAQTLGFDLVPQTRTVN